MERVHRKRIRNFLKGSRGRGQSDVQGQSFGRESGEPTEAEAKCEIGGKTTISCTKRYKHSLNPLGTPVPRWSKNS